MIKTFAEVFILDTLELIDTDSHFLNLCVTYCKQKG